MQTLLNPNVSANSLNSNVRQSGAGEVALVFLHYFGGSSRSWDEVTARLPDFRCRAPDL